MASHLVVAVLAVVAACCAATSLREKRQAFGKPAFSCTSDGVFVDPEDCSKYYQCFNGESTKQQCQDDLLFNALKGWCDYPMNVDGSQCRKPVAAESRCPISNEVSLVSHESFCNAFFICGNGRLYPQCVFCGEGLYFDDQVNECVAFSGDNGGIDCGNREMIIPFEETLKLLEPSCRPGQKDVYAPLRAKIMAARAQPSQG